MKITENTKVFLAFSRWFLRSAVGMGTVMQANDWDAAGRPANAHALHDVRRRLRRHCLYAFQNLCCFSLRHYE